MMSALPDATTSGDFLTRLFIWLALVTYPMATGLILWSPGDPRRRMQARAVWTLGCVFFLAHVFCAFAFFHHWSHAEAYRETARQTSALTGWTWGGGVYFNYVFAAAWLGDVLWWWLASRSFARRPTWISATWRGFFFFMVFNGAIVFGHGPVRVLGVLICLTLAALWVRCRHQHIAT